MPGGVYDAREVAAAKARDPLVSRHYEDIVPAALQPVIVEHDRFVYVSYRKHDEIYWTKHPVLLRSGETILWDGRREIRGRCGNRISMYPLLPVADDEPTAMELDALLDDAPSVGEGEVEAAPVLARRGRPGLAAISSPSGSSPALLAPDRSPDRGSDLSGSRFTNGSSRLFGGPLVISNPSQVADPELPASGGGSTRPSSEPTSGRPSRGGDP